MLIQKGKWVLRLSHCRAGVEADPPLPAQASLALGLSLSIMVPHANVQVLPAYLLIGQND